MSRPEPADKNDDRSGRDVSTRQHALIVELLAGHNLTDAARRANVSLATAKRWKQQEAFVTALREAQSDRLRQTTAILSLFGRDAALILRRAADDKNVPDAVRVRAATVLLREARAYVEISDLEQRLSDLEATVVRREGIE